MNELLDFARGLQWWHWWVAAAVLAAIETFMPGAVAIWFAAAAVVVGALLLVVPVPWQLQLVLFGVLGCVALLVWRRLRRNEPLSSDQPNLNQRGLQYVGQEFTLVEPGKVRVADTVWKVRGVERPVGTTVRVTGVDGSTLVVEPVINS